MYQWHQTREHNLQGHFNFYYNISKDSMSGGSMFMYMLLLLSIGVVGDLISELVKMLLPWFK